MEFVVGRHQRARAYTPRHNGRVALFNRLLVDEVRHAETCGNEQARRTAVGTWRTITTFGLEVPPIGHGRRVGRVSQRWVVQASR
ncbi:IS481 family transposase, partial [Kocuria sp. HR5S1]